MLLVDEARKRLLDNFSVIGTEKVDFRDAVGRVLAESAVANNDSPAFTHSAMDGIAVIARDLRGAGEGKPVRLNLIGKITAGESLNTEIESGQAALIMTGAPLPDGADAVVRVEDTDLDYTSQDFPESVAVFRRVDSGDNIRQRAENYSSGQTIMNAGRTLLPQDIGMFAMLGISNISVFKQPHVGIFASGDELVEPGTPLDSGQIWNSNSHMLSALVKLFGAKVTDLGIIPDTESAILDAFNTLHDLKVDLILTSGGVSMGMHDFVRIVIQRRGQLDFWKVNMRPGKPLAFGHFRGTAFIGLPGNPVSSFVGGMIFVGPAISKMLGKPDEPKRTSQAVLGEDLVLDGRESYLPGTLSLEQDTLKVVTIGNQSSGNLFALVQANCLIKVPPGVQSLRQDSIVQVWYFV